MTDDLVERLRETSGKYDEYCWHSDIELEAANRIEELNRAVLDLAQYVSSADLGFYIEPETKKVLSEIGEKDDN
jgi:hypothetical protein